MELMQIENLSVEDLLNLVKKQLIHVKLEEIFTVKDLFFGIEWNRLPIGTRTKLGMFFFSYIKSNGNSSIVSIGKTSQNQQKYKRIN